MSTVMDSYSETNQSSFLGQNASIFTGQSFTGNGESIVEAKFYMYKASGATGNCTAKIYAHSGTFGSTGVPTGTALATSDNVDISTLSTSPTFALQSFIFSTPYLTVNGTKYFVVLDSSGLTANTITNALDGTSPSHAGNNARFSGSWTARSEDMCFYVYGEVAASGPANLKSYNTNVKANIKSINTNPIANIKSLNTNV